MFTTGGALLGLVVAIVLIVRRMVPAYALLFGALAGGVVGGGGLVGTVTAMIDGTKAMMPSVLRILASGVLVGALVKTGSAAKISDSIVSCLGKRFSLAAIAVATAVVCAVGVFIDIAVITVAPVALAVGRRAGFPVPAILLAMIGGGKAGNIVSPNPNTLAAADAFHVDLTALIGANVIPAFCALASTVLLAHFLASRLGKQVRAEETDGVSDSSEEAMPALWKALAGPLSVVSLLALRPMLGVSVDPLVALPVGGIVTTVLCGAWRKAAAYAEFGLGKVAGVAVLLIGTGTVAGVIKGSSLNADAIALLSLLHLPTAALAPISGIIMAAATASTTAGATVASQTFSEAILAAGVSARSAAAMVHSGATVLDSLPHGSFFHATGGAVAMSMGARLKLIPFEATIGLVSTAVSVWINQF